MTQLHCYVPEEAGRQLQRRAEQAGLSLSRYLAELVKRGAAQDKVWPEGYFDLFVPIEGAEIERATQGECEHRLPLE